LKTIAYAVWSMVSRRYLQESRPNWVVEICGNYWDGPDLRPLCGRNGARSKNCDLFSFLFQSRFVIQEGCRDGCFSICSGFLPPAPFGLKYFRC